MLGCIQRQVNESEHLRAPRWHSMRRQKPETPDSFPFRFLREALLATRLSGRPHELVAALAFLSNQHLAFWRYDFFDFR
jgi:hypothetical protein